VGWTHVTDCVQEHHSKWKQEGSWGFVLRNSSAIEFKPWKGKLNFFNVPKERALRLLMRIKRGPHHEHALRTARHLRRREHPAGESAAWNSSA
jgi:hypothetical protein